MIELRSGPIRAGRLSAIYNFCYHECTVCALGVAVGEAAHLTPEQCPQRPEGCCGHSGAFPPACPEGVAGGEGPACRYRSRTLNHPSHLLHRRPRVCHAPHESAQRAGCCSLYARTTHLCDKLLPQITVLEIWHLGLLNSQGVWTTNVPMHSNQTEQLPEI